MRELQPILTITGSDSTGGSGVQADIKTISELGGYAVSAITSITVQNTLGIQEFFDVPAEIVSGQIEAIMNDIQPSVVKVGMIRKVETLDVIIDALTKYRPDYIVYAPAIWSSNGDALMTEDVVSQIKYRLLPLCSAVVARKKENDIMLQDSIIGCNITQKLSSQKISKAFSDLGFNRLRTKHSRGFIAIIRTAEEIRNYQISQGIDASGNLPF